MTVLIKPSLIIKKIPLISGPPCKEMLVNMQPSLTVAAVSIHRRRAATCVLLAMSLGIVLMAMLGIVTAWQVILQNKNDELQHLHYQGYCSIPLSKDMQMLESRKVALRWQEANAHTDNDMQVVNLVDNMELEVPSANLREMLDISVDDCMERIAVYTNGYPVRFLHDFESNTTGVSLGTITNIVKERQEAEKTDTKILKAEINYTGQRETLRKLLHKLGFRFKRTQSNRKVLMERNEISAWKARYLHEVDKNNKLPNPKPMVYLDETYIHLSHTSGKCWQGEGVEGILEPVLKGQTF